MPLYEYRCKQCGHVFEKIQSFSAPDVKECPRCSSEVERLISAPAIQFKGSGFYLTDYGKSGGGAAKGSAGSESGGGSGESKPSGDAKGGGSSGSAGSGESSGSSSSSSGAGAGSPSSSTPGAKPAGGSGSGSSSS